MASFTVEIQVSASSVPPLIWKGWGTSLMWWAHFVGGLPQPDQDRILDLLFNQDPSRGLGFTIVRYNIPGGFDPKADPQLQGSFLALPGYRPSPAGPYDWGAGGRQRAILMGAKKRGVQLFEAFSCSPPPWMTVSGSVTGGNAWGEDNLRPEMYEEFAEYLAETIRHYRDEFGVEFQTLEPFNEPVEGWWVKGGRQEGCNFKPHTMSIVLVAVSRRLAAKGIGGVKLAGVDTFVKNLPNTLAEMDPSAVQTLTKLNVHSYHGQEPKASNDFFRNDRSGLRECARSIGREAWQSEAGPLNFRADMGDLEVALNIALTVIMDINVMRVVAWVYWQAFEQDSGTHWGLIQAKYSYDQPFQYKILKQYYIFKHLTRIRPGARILPIPPRYSHCLLAAIDPDHSTLIIILCNADVSPDSAPLTLPIVFSGLRLSPESTFTVHRTSSSENYVNISPEQPLGGAAHSERHLLHHDRTSLSVTCQPGSVTSYVVQGIEVDERWHDKIQSTLKSFMC